MDRLAQAYTPCVWKLCTAAGQPLVCFQRSTATGAQQGRLARDTRSRVTAVVAAGPDAAAAAAAADLAARDAPTPRSLVTLTAELPRGVPKRQWIEGHVVWMASSEGATLSAL